jgi:hypothetical protein
VFPEMFLDVIISISPDENVPNKVTDVFVWSELVVTGVPF